MALCQVTIGNSFAMVKSQAKFLGLSKYKILKKLLFNSFMPSILPYDQTSKPSEFTYVKPHQSRVRYGLKSVCKTAVCEKSLNFPISSLPTMRLVINMDLANHLRLAASSEILVYPPQPTGL